MAYLLNDKLITVTNYPKACLNPKRHYQVFALALPMVLSNVTIPLLGLVDTIVIGHLQHAYFLGGVALGSTIINLLFFLLNFLRMSTTGLTAQAYGAKKKDELLTILWRAVFLAWGLALVLLLLQKPLVDIAFYLSNASTEVEYYARQYVQIRIWSAPAALTNLVFLGWLLGNQNARAPMILLIFTNIVNIVLDVYFVMGLGWQVQGAAGASVLADYAAFFVGLYLVYKVLNTHQIHQFKPQLKKLFEPVEFIRLVALNRDIFIRALCLQATFAFVAFKGAGLGDNIVAANAVLMNFLMFISFALDGFAFAAEAMVGRAVGAKSEWRFRLASLLNLLWGLIIALAFTVFFVVSGPWLIDQITSIPEVRSEARVYLPWLIAMPLVAFSCYVFDGIFIGATRGVDMRNMMLLSTFGVFFPIWFMSQSYENHALWFALLCFMGARGITLGITWWRLKVII